jgi:hypothetical protein
MEIKNQIVHIMSIPNHKYERQIWIGLVKVSSLKENEVLNGAKKAFGTVIGFSTTKLKFRAAIAVELSELGMKLERLENAETLIQREKKFVLQEQLYKLINQTVEKKKQIGFLTFHTYD